MIRAFQGTSLIEYPGKVCSVVFFGGCNLYCPFCHNPELVLPDLLARQYTISPDMIIDRLAAREGFIEAVTITGGEPLISPELEDLIDAVRERTDLLIKVDTNGTLPDKLRGIADRADYVAMDLKSSPEGYPRATGGRAEFDDIRESVDIVRGLPGYELRTTMVPGIVDRDGLIEALSIIGPVARFAIQRFRSAKTLSPEFRDIQPYTEDYLRETAEAVSEYAEEVQIRG